MSLEVIKVQHLPTLGITLTPTRAHMDDAGFDLYVSEETVIPAHSFVDVPSSVAVQLPAGAWGLLTGRSSTLRKRGLLVNTGIIDPGYRGELYSGLWNLTDEAVTLKPGERVAQLIIIDNMTARTTMRAIEGDLDEHERGEKGFGSSGR